MIKFNKLFNTKTTRVKVGHLSKWFKVIEIHETRNWIKVNGLCGSFQRGHIVKFTNKSGSFLEYMANGKWLISN